LVTRDKDESQEFLGRLWERHQTQLRGSAFSVRWHQADLRHASLAYVDHPCAITATCEGPLSDSFRLLFHQAGRIEHRINSKDAVSTPGAIALHVPGQELRLEIKPFRLTMLSLDGAFVRPALTRRFGRLPPFETWAAEFPLQSPWVSALRSLCHWTAEELDQPGSALLALPQVRRHHERTLLSLFLECLAERHPGEAARMRGLADRQLRRIEAWMEANLGEPIGLEEAAAMAGVSARSMQSAFKSAHGCSPMQWLIRRRLEHARHLLQRPDATTTVTDVATACGFFQFGRFSVRYRQCFGEKPSETLAKARRRFACHAEDAPRNSSIPA
jgi:AraC-like DNA-binding protein